MIKRLVQNNKLIFLIISSLVFVLVGCTTVQQSSRDEVDILSFEDLQGEIEIEKAMEHIQNLVDFGPRIAGLYGEVKAGKYLLESFKNLNLITESEEFPVKTFEAKSVEMTINNQGNSISLAANIIDYSTSTPEGGLKDLPLIYAGLGKVTDLVGLDLTDAISVVHRGDIYLRDKVINSASKGAKAVIIINTEDNPLISSLLEESTIPAIGLSSSEGEKIVEALEKGKFLGNLTVDTTIKDGTSSNIIGTKKSSKETDKVLIIGAHYDSVNTPGANDNAAGVGGLLEIASVLKDIDLPFNIQYIAFGAEEMYLVGSNFHVQQKYTTSNKNVIGMINLDGIGMGQRLVVHKESRNSSNYLSKMVLESAYDLNIKAVEYFNGVSDHIPFENLGIPVVFLQYVPGNLDYYETEYDTFDTLDSKSIENTIKVVLKTITTLVNEH